MSTFNASSSACKSKKVGGEYGEVRASIDVDKLNAYLGETAKEIKVPVQVKQFKVQNRLFFTSIDAH